jgi:hypothetical protein
MEAAGSVDTLVLNYNTVSLHTLGDCKVRFVNMRSEYEISTSVTRNLEQEAYNFYTKDQNLLLVFVGS